MKGAVKVGLAVIATALALGAVAVVVGENLRTGNPARGEDPKRLYLFGVELGGQDDMPY